MKYQWYIIHTSAGSERKVKENILIQAKKKDMLEMFNDIIIPSVQINSVQKGKHVKLEKKVMPSYVIINMIMTDESWHLVKNVPKVTGFLGNNSPKSISEYEINKILGKISEKAKEIYSSTILEIGENVKVIDGPFESFVGTIEGIDNDKSRIKVSITIFGRSTPVELNSNQVKKI